MVEKVQFIKNPLTIIGIFAALSEISATIAVGLIDKELQKIFIWFLIGFPTLLVLMFFLTLNFNTRVMYSPSDYTDEKHFVKILLRNQEVSKELENLNNSIKIKLENKADDPGVVVALQEISSEIDKIKENSETISFENWHLNHWKNKYAELRDNTLYFTSAPSDKSVDGCNIDLADYLEINRFYEISCYVSASANATGKIQLWCHDKGGAPNGVSVTTDPITPPTTAKQIALIFKAEYNRNIRIHLQYTPVEGCIAVNAVRVKLIA